MKKMRSFMLSICLCFTALSGCAKENELITIGLAQIVEHPSLNTIREAIIDELAVLGYVEGENITIDYKNAQNEPNNLTSIMQTYVGNEVDMIVAIATPTAMAAAPYAEDVPVIFSAVSDPVQAGLMDDLDHPNHNMTGTSDEIQVDQILDLANQIISDLNTLGFIYNASEANSVSNLAKTRAYCEENDIELIEMSVANVGEIMTVASALAQQCDAIFAPNDNTIASGIDALNKVSIDLSCPIFVGADSMVSDGGFASVGINYEELGRETARMIAAVLEGTDIADIPVKVFDENLFTYINETTADALSIEIPEEIFNSETTVLMK